VPFSGGPPVQASDRHPQTFEYQRRRLAVGTDWLPDAVTDTTAKRRRGAARLLGDGEGIIPRLLAQPHGQLHHAVVFLPIGIDFYRDAPGLGRAAVRQLFGNAPLYAKVALSRSCKPHVHVLVVLPAGFQLPCTGSNQSPYLKKVRDESHVRRLALYFSRPHDERACRYRPDNLRRYAKGELELQPLDASELYLTARQGAATRCQRLPRRSWTSMLPYLNRARPNTLPTAQATSETLRLRTAPCTTWVLQRPALRRPIYPGQPIALMSGHSPCQMLHTLRQAGEARAPP
jgi:hypothetical protein